MAFIDDKRDGLQTDSELDPVDEILRQINEKKIIMPDEQGAVPENNDAAQTLSSAEDADDKSAGGGKSVENGEQTENDEEDDETDEEPVDESERCERCGKRRRDTSIAEDYEYCSNCRAAMLKAPLKWQGFIAAVALIFIAGIAFVVLFLTAPVALPVSEAKGYESQKRLNDALTSYEAAQAEADTLNTQLNMGDIFTPGTKTFAKKIQTMAKFSPISAGQTLSTAITEEKDYKNIWLKPLKQYSDMYAALQETAGVAEPIITEYQDAEAADVPYDDLILKLEALKTGENAGKYAEYYIEYCKYYAAVFAKKGPETELGHLLEVKKLSPSANWLYFSPLTSVYKTLEKNDELIAECNEVIAVNVNTSEVYSLKARAYCAKGDFEQALAVCGEMEKANTVSAASYALKAEILRRKGDVDLAAAACEEGLAELNKQNEIASSETSTDKAKQEASAKLQGSTEFYRQQAIILLLKDDKAGAYEAALNAYNSTSYYQDATLELINTVALCASLAGETEKYDEMIAFLAEYDYTLAESADQIIKGTKTVQEVFVGGKGDVL